MTRLAALLLAALPAFSDCMCIPVERDPCSALSGTSVAFLGTVISENTGSGTAPLRVHVDSPLLRVPEGVREVELELPDHPSCRYPLEAGQRYVIFADPISAKPARLSLGICTPTFPLSGNEHLLEALKNQAEGGPPRLVGTVLRRSGRSSPEGVVPGARVTAQSESHRYQATTNAHGTYEIAAMHPGRYFVEVTREGFVPDLDYNKRSNGLIPNPLTRRLEPEPRELHGSVVMRENSCRTRNLAMWPHGRISGTVHDHLGNPAPGVTVQAFTVNDSGNRESSPIRTALSDSHGRYRIESLPAGDYFIAVNGNNALNSDPYPPAFHSSGPNSPPAKLQLSESAELSTVDLTLQPKRTRATLRVHLVGHDGSPFRGSHLVGVYSDAREYRWGKLVDSAPDGVIEIPVFLGDRYLVEAGDYSYGASAPVTMDQPTRSVTLVLQPKR